MIDRNRDLPIALLQLRYCKLLIIEPAFCGSRLSTGRLLAIEDFTFNILKKSHDLDILDVTLESRKPF